MQTLQPPYYVQLLLIYSDFLEKEFHIKNNKKGLILL